MKSSPSTSRCCVDLPYNKYAKPTYSLSGPRAFVADVICASSIDLCKEGGLGVGGKGEGCYVISSPFCVCCVGAQWGRDLVGCVTHAFGEGCEIFSWDQLGKGDA